MRHHAALDDHLSNVPLFATMSLKEREAVRALLSEVDVPAGARLAREGAIGHEFFIIVSGTASVEHEGVHVADVGPGDYQGELSLLDGGRRTATVTATSPMTVMVASQQEFNQLLDEHPTIARRMLPSLAARVRAFAD
jgi:CRP/FNR family transcriptional regulator, cyclic AMP receptor protein